MRITTLFLAALAALPACRSDTTATELDSWMRATIARAFAAQHIGEAEWMVGTPSPGRTWRTITSEDHTADARLSLNLISADDSWREGVYALEEHEWWCSLDRDAASAYYERDGVRYIAESGTLTITSAEGRIVEGFFEMTAVAFVRSNHSGCPVWTIAPDAQRIDVWGEFAAVRENRQPVEF
jgi:hypothetical protein